MTLNQFFKEVRTLRGKFEVNREGEVRTKRERYTESVGYKCLCPIEELYRARTKKSFHGSLDAAARNLGLSATAEDRIIGAADVKNVSYRKPLLKALGLKEAQ